MFECQPGDLVEPVRGGPSPGAKRAGEDASSKLAGLRPRRARVAPVPKGR